MLKMKSSSRFILIFLSLFLLFYYFNIFFFGLTFRGHYYQQFLDKNLNYIKLLRHFLLYSTAQSLALIGFSPITNDTELLLVGHGTISLNYSCLGFGIMSFFTAFVIAYPGRFSRKLLFALTGDITIQFLNICRFVLLALFWKRGKGVIIDHHTAFNIVIYLLILISLYVWVKRDFKVLNDVSVK